MTLEETVKELVEEAVAKALSESRRETTGVVLVRTDSAGVHFGKLISRNGKEVELSNVRRIWNWGGANSLNEIALHGITSGKVSEPVPLNTLTEAIEILPMTQAAIRSLEKIGWVK